MLFIKTRHECNVILNMLLKSSSWNPHAKFQIFVDYLERDWRQLVTYLLDQFWQHYVIDIIVNIAVNETISQSRVCSVLVAFDCLFTKDIRSMAILLCYQILTWMPYEKGNCGTNPGHFIELARCENSQVFPKDADLFPPKVFIYLASVITISTSLAYLLQVPRILNGCSIRVAMFAGPPAVGPPHNAELTEDDISNARLTEGFEVRIMQTLADKMNFNTSYL